MQAPKETIEKYTGRYEEGYDALQISRFERMEELGLNIPGMRIAPRVPTETDWDSLTQEEKSVETRKMEIYAAMVDDLDRYFGMVLESLKRNGDFENTFIFFMSDNGPEGAHLEIGWDALSDWVNQCCDNSLGNMGEADSYLWYGPNWARAGTPPFRMFKGFTTEGGTRAPAIVYYPKAIPGGVTQGTMTTVMDVLPTILELAGIEHPQTFNESEILPLRGSSMLSVLTGERSAVHPEDYIMGWELFGRRGIRQGDWKIVWEPIGIPWEPRDPDISSDSWRLYNIANDPGEQIDLSKKEPERLNSLVKQWDSYVQNTGVVIPDYNVGYAH